MSHRPTARGSAPRRAACTDARAGPQREPTEGRKLAPGAAEQIAWLEVLDVDLLRIGSKPGRLQRAEQHRRDRGGDRAGASRLARQARACCEAKAVRGGQQERRRMGEASPPGKSARQAGGKARLALATRAGFPNRRSAHSLSMASFRFASFRDRSRGSLRQPALPPCVGNSAPAYRSPGRVARNGCADPLCSYLLHCGHN